MACSWKVLLHHWARVPVSHTGTEEYLPECEWVTVLRTMCSPLFTFPHTRLTEVNYYHSAGLGFSPTAGEQLGVKYFAYSKEG